MPYIIQPKRDVLDSAINELHKLLVDLEMDDDTNNMEGNLNYIITRLIRMCYGESYAEINDVMGMLTCVMMEHYRTVAAPYEEQKRFDNGEVEANLHGEHILEIVVEKKSDEPNSDMLVETKTDGIFF